MAIKLTTTAQAAADNGLKVLVHGPAGAGKTTLCATTDEPTVIISAEGGLLSLRGHDIPVIVVASIEDVSEAYRFITEAEEAKSFRWVCLDSISEIAEVCLAQEKARAKDPRQAYGAMQEAMTDLIRAFRDLPGRNVYFSAKLEKTTDEMGKILYGPSMPGNKTGQLLPYFFDLVLALRVEKDADGVPTRILQCQPDGAWLAKDRSGKLAMWEQPDLGAIIKTIQGENE
jgi:phage nucleotide-binding protein